MNPKTSFLHWWMPFIALSICAYFIHINFYLHKDLAIITHTAAQILQGQTYAHHIFEPNPPLIFYLHAIPVLISSITGIKLIYVFRLAIIGLIAISLRYDRACLKYFLFTSAPKKIENDHLLNKMSFAIAFVLLFLPANAFGQREHIYFILTLPYVLLALCRLNQDSIPFHIALVIGIMAGIGFSIKPFFLSTLLVLEGWLIYKERRLWVCLRIEMVITLTIIILYGIGIAVFYPAYITKVLPLWTPYYRGITHSLIILLTAPLFLWCCSPILLSFYDEPNEPYLPLQQVFIVGIVGSLISHLIPQVNWYYHILPAVSFACLYFAVKIKKTHFLDCRLSNRIVTMLINAFITGVIFFLPIQNSLIRTIDEIKYFHSSNPEKKIISLFENNPKHNSYMFLSMTHNLCRLEYYSTAPYVGSISSCIWEYLRLGKYTDSFKARQRSLGLKIITEDIHTHQPEFIIIDSASALNYLKQSINYPLEYSKSPSFRSEWSHYTYLSNIDHYKIYQRQPSSVAQ